uniref:THAP domain-containing protein 1 n=1 Tax=Sparus aurata TaxID=8175 RepID=A0A671U4C5_SPAAU
MVAAEQLPNEWCCRYNSVLSFHLFPQDASLRAKWLHRIRRVQFTVTQHMKVCSHHFEESLIRTTANGKHVLSRDAVPSLFDWNDYSVKRRTIWESLGTST